jgi:hypothetical protein
MKSKLMPRIATTEDEKPIEKAVGPGVRVAQTAQEGKKQSENPVGPSVRVAETEQETAGPGRRPAAQAPQRTAWVTDLMGPKPAATDHPSAVAPRSAFAMFNAAGNIGTFWFSLAQDQMAANLATLSKLAVTRDWRDRLEIQSSFLRGNLARMSEGMARSAELAAHFVSSCAPIARTENGDEACLSLAAMRPR